MKMVTSCPACGTSFRIHNDQIDARGGQVRCGHCTVVFDAHMHLQMEPELPPPMEESRPPEALDTPFSPSNELPLPPDSAEEADAETSTSAGAEPKAKAASDDDEYDEDDVPTLEELGFGKKSRTKGRKFWFAASLLFFLLLTTQLLYYFRSDLVVYAPSLRPLVEMACAQAGCVIPLPQHADMVSIESDEMQFDRSKSEVITLSAILRNRAPFDQAYPAIELTLTDEGQAALTRRVLRPQEYLDEAHQKTLAFAANSELAVQLHIDAAGLNASGYRMEITYAPITAP